ncbi:MAG: hypothetical protein ABI670_13560 [Chloroflexota bacterium]
MRSSAGNARMGRLSGSPRSGWLNLTWKILLAIGILLLMSIRTPFTWVVDWSVLNPIPATIILWGALFVGIAASNLFEGTRAIRWGWMALTLGAYLALTIPSVVAGPDRLVDALGPVAALTLVAHLGRRDLQRALRDWGLVMGLSLYSALGVQAMWLVVNSFGNSVGPVVFLVAVLLPPLIFEAVLLFLRRVDSLRDSMLAHIVALVLSTSVAVIVFSFTLLNNNTQLGWRIIFGLMIGLLIGGALMIGLLTQPLISAASGSRSASPAATRINLGRALVELSHEPILISLAIYVPLRLLSFFAAR